MEPLLENPSVHPFALLSDDNYEICAKKCRCSLIEFIKPGQYPYCWLIDTVAEIRPETQLEYPEIDHSSEEFETILLNKAASILHGGIPSNCTLGFDSIINPKFIDNITSEDN